MSSIDRRVVEMEFDNRGFERGIRDTLSSLEALKRGLSEVGDTGRSARGLENVGKSHGLGAMADALDNISSKFSAMGAVGFAVIQRLTNGAIDFAQKVGRMIFDPLVGGGRRRALNIEQAKFQFRGLGMDVEATMASALEAVQGTAYGLDEAAKAAGQFGASGMRAGDDMTSALRAISGVAAMTSSSYDDIANVFTKVAGNGRLMGDDLLRLSARGLNAAATLADHLGITEAEVRQLVTEGKISFEMFYKAMDEAFGENATKANETYTGSLANMRAALARIGAKFFTPWLEQQRDLFNALSPAIDDVNEAITPVIEALAGFTGASTKRLIDFINRIDFSKLSMTVDPFLGIVRNVFAGIKSVLGPIKDAFRQIFPPTSIETVTKILVAIEKFTARIKMGAEGASNLQRTFAGLFAVLGIGWEIVKAGAKFFFDLFDVVFDGGVGFLEFTAIIGDWLVALHSAIKNGESLTKFFSGLSGVLSGPIRFIKDFVKNLLNLADIKPPNLARLKVSFEPMKSMGEAIKRVWSGIGDVLKRVWTAFQPIARAIGDFSSSLGTALADSIRELDFSKVLSVINTGLLGGLLLTIRKFVNKSKESFDFGDVGGDLIEKITGPFGALTDTLSTMQNTLRAATLLQIGAAVGILAAAVIGLSKVDSDGLTRALTAISIMFTQLFAFMLAFTKIGGVRGLFTTGAGLIVFAAGIRVLVSSVKALAELEWGELAKGLTGVGVLIGVVTIAVRGMAGQTAGMFTAGAGLLVLAAGIKVLSSAVIDLAELSWEDMAKGLVGVGTLLGALAIFTRLVAVNKAGVLQGAGLLLLAAGIKVLASAVEDFAEIGWQGIGKGLASITAILAAFAIFSKALNPSGLIRAGISLVLIGGAMHILADATAKFADMKWEEIGRGLAGMGGALAGIVLALNLMPPNTLASAAALVTVSFALGMIADVMGQMGGMSWDQVAVGLTTLAGSLVIIAGAMFLMTGALPGAAALIVVATALRIFAPVLQSFGEMSLVEIAQGLGVLAGVFIILGAAGILLAPVVPVLLGLGVAITLLGVGMLAAGAGVVAFSVGLTALSVAGAAATAALVGMIAAIAGALPMVAQQIGLALVAFAEVIAHSGQAMFEAMSAVIGAMIKAVHANLPAILRLFRDLIVQLLKLAVDLIPKMAGAFLKIMVGILREVNRNAPTIVRALITLIVNMLNEMAKGMPRFVRAATNLMVAFLNGVKNNLGRVIRAGTDVIIALLNGISDNMVRIADAGMKAVINFINGVATAIRNNTAALQSAGRNLASAIVSGLTGGLSDKVGAVASKARELANGAVSAIKGVFKSSSPSKVFYIIGLGVGQGLINGLSRMAPRVRQTSRSVGTGAVDAMKDSLSTMTDILETDMDLNPTITPVLDLSEFRRDTTLIDALMSNKQLLIDRAAGRARLIALRQRINEGLRSGEITVPRTFEEARVIFNQYNTSPKALSSADIYRQTKNQLSKTKGALTPNVAQKT